MSGLDEIGNTMLPGKRIIVIIPARNTEEIDISNVRQPHNLSLHFTMPYGGARRGAPVVHIAFDASTQL